ncbi:MAG: esterase family protein [Ruminococcus sp.]|nr:esterase family protein [Ruminococcus sp.]
MKRVLSAVVAGIMVMMALAACGANQTLEREENAASPDTAQTEEHGDFHTLYFRDGSKSQKVAATFLNSLTGESEDVEMVKCGEDADAYIFSCEGNVRKYNVAYFTYDDNKTKRFAFNRCVSGWQKAGKKFTPYTQGAETEYIPSYEQIMLDCNGYEKKIFVWVPEDYKADADEKYATIYVLDGQSEVNIQNPQSSADSSLCIPEQVRSMTAQTGYKAIIVAVSTYGDMTNVMRDDELVPDLGKFAEEGYTSKQKGGDFARFMAETLVPYIQQRYNVYTDALHTAVTGASLGGLETFYITLEYPEVFGTAGVQSPSFWTYDDAAWKSYLEKKDFANHTPFLYLYTGPAGGDTDPYVTEMYHRLQEMNYPADKLAFHFNENGGHHENYWRAYFAEFLEAMALRHVDVLQR